MVLVEPLEAEDPKTAYLELRHAVDICLLSKGCVCRVCSNRKPLVEGSLPERLSFKCKQWKDCPVAFFSTQVNETAHQEFLSPLIYKLLFEITHGWGRFGFYRYSKLYHGHDTAVADEKLLNNGPRIPPPPNCLSSQSFQIPQVQPCYSQPCYS